MRAQQLELIYSQSGLLYEIFPDVPRSILDKARQKSGPHVDGIVGSTQEIPLINCQINCNNCRYNRQRPARPLVRLFPLPKCRTYTVCSRRTRRPTNSLKERKNNETRRVRGIRNPTTMLVGETQRRESRSICVTFAWRTIRLTCALDLWRPRSYWQQQPVVLTNPFPHGKNMTQASSSVDGGSQGPPRVF
jgi:hypothetical protein